MVLLLTFFLSGVGKMPNYDNDQGEGGGQDPGAAKPQSDTIPSSSSSFSERNKRSLSGLEALLPETAEGKKYSVTFDEAPTLSEDVIGFLKNRKRK